ncbi:endo-1,4-beta-xylanase [Herbiconiux sp. SYSU D00978]|uniref:endo-1,4-beta-xylanase n=1 Tax=Herbiconiux sp. SYSU D00978 TaxID=2812562 RepID=UPI001A97B6C9|nr:endo-1,4-beta-xylanase [Herbiconiux sp. SYSU D00978]
MHIRTPRRATRLAVTAAAATALVLAGTLPATAANGKHPSLRDAAPADLVIGTAAAGGGHHLAQDYEGLEPGQSPFLHDQQYRRELKHEFSSLSPENQMKWEFIHPEQGRYDFAEADAIVKFARQHKQDVRGHTLLWHSQNPAWVEEGDFTAEELRAVLKDHIQTLVGRYKGQIDQWDVANEIFDEGGNLRTSENIWIRELGPGIIADAFRWAHEADPDAKLFFNDYNVEWKGPKSNAYYALIQDLLKQDVPVDGFSVQGHLSTQYGFPGDLRENLQRFDDLGLETAITELDVRMNVPEGQQPTESQLAQQADYYQQALEACLAVDDCNSFTIWGFTDRYSWVPVFFTGEGFANVMTEDYERKPAYYALRDTLLAAAGGK